MKIWEKPTRLLAIAASMISMATADETIKVRCLAFQPGFPGELHAHDPSGSATAGLVEIKQYLNHETVELNLKSNKLAFTRTLRPESATDVNEVVGNLEVPANLKSAILVFLASTEDRQNPKASVMVVDDSVAAFPAGSFKVANFSEFPAKIELEGVATEIAPGATKVISNVKFNESQTASMQAYSKQGDDWVTVSTGSLANPGTKRVLEVFYKDPASKLIKFTGVKDVVSPR